MSTIALLFNLMVTNVNFTLISHVLGKLVSLTFAANLRFEFSTDLFCRLLDFDFSTDATFR